MTFAQYMCGWSVNRAIISTIAENTAHVLDVSYVVFVQNIWKWKKRKKNGKCASLEYLSWYVANKSKCFFNHEESPQVNIFSSKFY